MDCSSGYQNTAIPQLFEETTKRVSAPLHNQGVEAEEEGNQQHGAMWIPVSPRRVIQAGTPWVSRSLLGWVSWPRLQAPPRRSDAVGFSPGAARHRGGTQQVPPPSKLDESSGGSALAGLCPPGACEDGGSGKEERNHPCSQAVAAPRRAVNYNLLAVNNCCVV